MSERTFGLLGHKPLVAAINAGMEKTANKRQAIPIVAAGVLQPPVPISPPPSRDAINEAFAATRDIVARLEQERELVHIGGSWSPSQHARNAA